MSITIKKNFAGHDEEKMLAAALHPEGQTANPNQLLRLEGIIGRRDSLTELQQKILSVAISLVFFSKNGEKRPLLCKININEFLKLCDIEGKTKYSKLISELEKLSRRGLWFYRTKQRNLIRSQWFQTIDFENGEIAFRFSDMIANLVAVIEPENVESQLIKGIQYRGKHTKAVFDIIWSARDAEAIGHTIDELMKLLSLEHTRYSYGQLKLRVLEPSIQEIYDWDDSIFIRFGPSFSGRRVEGIWVKVITGEVARELRKKEPKFKFETAEKNKQNPISESLKENMRGE